MFGFTLFTKNNCKKSLYILQANILHWTCLQQLPNIYHSNLWANMQIVLDVIKDGVKVIN